jgi:predicted phosphoribosyltransferase
MTATRQSGMRARVVVKNRTRAMRSPDAPLPFVAEIASEVKTMSRPFRDRSDAGRQLASRLLHLRDRRPIVLALPRGGVPIGYEIAKALRAPLDVLNVRKLGVPWHEELAIGAIATGGIRVLNNDVILSLGVSAEDLDEVVALQNIELDRRERLYRGGRPAPALEGRTVILVDDGIATGATIRAAIQVVRAQRPVRLVVATPVAQATIAAEIARLADEFVAVHAPADLFAVGVWYDDFEQLSDADVRHLLARASSLPVDVSANAP